LIARTTAVPQRILLAKLGFDGHDRGVKILATLFREAGHDVIYLGKYLTVEAVVNAALEEDVDFVGLSFLGGAHVVHSAAFVEAMRQCGLDHVRLIVGGVIPRKDFSVLQELGIEGIFDANTPSADILRFIDEHAREQTTT